MDVEKYREPLIEIVENDQQGFIQDSNIEGQN